ncbi:hypothetical protein AN220_13395, partial [Streptomyces nanshensis]
MALADEARDELGLPPADRVATTSAGPDRTDPAVPPPSPAKVVTTSGPLAEDDGSATPLTDREARESAATAPAGPPTAADKGKGTLVSADPIPAPSTPEVSRRETQIALARADFDAARADFAAALDSIEQIGARVESGVGGSTDTDAALAAARVGADRAYGRWESAAERLRELGVDPTAWDESEDLSAVPHLAHDAAERRWIASRVTAADLPADLADLADADPAAHDAVTADELRKADVPPPGAVPTSRLPLAALAPVDRVRVLMVRSGPWSGVLDETAANMARRTWQEAYADFARTNAELAGGTKQTGSDALRQAWDTAMGLVLPLELHPVEALSWYAAGRYVRAVREVAHLLAEDVPRETARSLADRNRRHLGLRPRGRGGAPTPTARPGVPSLPPALTDLAARLPGMSAQERTEALALLPDTELDRLAGDRKLIRALLDGLSRKDFGATAAQLMVRVPEGVHEPEAARSAAQDVLAHMLRGPNATMRMLLTGFRAVVIPRDRPLTDFAPFTELRGTAAAHGGAWEESRGGFWNGHAGFAEENLLGEETSLSRKTHSADGYSDASHEFAHALHMTALPMPVVDHIRSVYQAKIEQERINEWALNWGQDDEFEPVHWPDGPYQDPRGRRPGTNYSSHDEYEYFAQLSNAYLGTNTGTDPYTGQPHNNGAQWVRDNDPALLPLLERLYGPVSEQGGLKANPYAEVQARKAAAVADDGARTGTTSSRPEAAATTAGETDVPPVLPEDQGQDTTADETVVASVLPLDPGTSTEETAPAPEPPADEGTTTDGTTDPWRPGNDETWAAFRGLWDDGAAEDSTPTTRPLGTPLPVPQDGESMLSAVLASDPALLRDRLPGLAERAPEAHAWLSDPARVRRDLAGPADALPDTPHAAVLTAVRGLVADRLQADRGRGATEALWQYRLSNLGDDSFAARVAGMDLAELVTRLADLGVPLPDQTAFETEEGLRGELSDLLLRHEPLDDRELTALTAAVLDWTDHWNSAEGEAFLPLLAHVLGVRFEIFRADRYGEGAGPLDFRRHQAVGPADAPRTVELFHTTSYTRRSVTENGETTTRWVPTGDQRYAGSTAVEPVTDTPPESAPTPTRAAQDPRLAPVPEPAPARTWSDLRELADEVIAHGPVAISALGPCAGLARRLTDRLFPGGGVRPGVPLDDLTSSRSATEFALA